MAGGIRVVEITLDSPDAEAVIAAARERHPDVLVGAGTVRTAADVDRAVDAGAAFCVAPATVPEALPRAAARGVPMVPGVLTPTEVERAVGLGAPVVKLFPGSLGVRPTSASCSPRWRGCRCWSPAGWTPATPARSWTQARSRSARRRRWRARGTRRRRREQLVAACGGR